MVYADAIGTLTTVGHAGMRFRYTNDDGCS